MDINWGQVFVWLGAPVVVFLTATLAWIYRRPNQIAEKDKTTVETMGEVLDAMERLNAKTVKALAESEKNLAETKRMLQTALEEINALREQKNLQQTEIDSLRQEVALLRAGQSSAG